MLLAISGSRRPPNLLGDDRGGPPARPGEASRGPGARTPAPPAGCYDDTVRRATGAQDAGRLVQEETRDHRAPQLAR